MVKHNQDGTASGLLIALIVAVMLLVILGVFTASTYSKEQDYKNNVDQKINVAVAAAVQRQQATDKQNYEQAAKLPLSTYKGPEADGSIIIKYPKSWSSYVDTSGNSSGGGGNALIDGYFYPGTVPSIEAEQSGDAGGANFALRVQFINDSYSDSLSNLQQQTGIEVKPYSLPKVPSVVGVRVTGQIEQNKTGDLIVLPVRGQTLEVWTEGNQFESDFTNSILPNLSFSP